LLRRLHLDHNQISVFPDSLTLLPHLTVLYLNNNNLQTLSQDIGRLATLEHLILHDNLITELPRGVTDLTAVQRFDLRHNQLKHLSKEFRSFQAEKTSTGGKILTAGNPLDKTLTRMLSVEQTSPLLRPRTMSFPLTGYGTRRKSESTPSPSPSPSHHRRHIFYHSQSEDRA
jgi:Leucine-rich repeat (LRR) protein